MRSAKAYKMILMKYTIGAMSGKLNLMPRNLKFYKWAKAL